MRGDAQTDKSISNAPETASTLVPTLFEQQQFQGATAASASSKNESGLTSLEIPPLPGFDSVVSSHPVKTPVSENEGVNVSLNLKLDNPGLVTIELMSPDNPYAPIFSEQFQATSAATGPQGENLTFHGITAASPDGLLLNVKTTAEEGKTTVSNLTIGESPPLTAGPAHFTMQGNGVVESKNHDTLQTDAQGKQIEMRNGKPFLLGFEIQSIKPGDSTPAQQNLQNFLEQNANAVTITPYWTQFNDPAKQAVFAKQADWAKDHDMQIKEHPAFWTHLVPPDATLADIKAHTQAIARLPGQFTEINETADANNAPSNGVTEYINQVGAAKATEQAIDWIRAADPHKTIIYNDFQNGQQEMTMLDQMQKDGKLPDAIGIQLHMDQGNWPLDKVENTVNQLAKYGKPIYITEISVMSGAPGESASKVNHTQIQALDQELKALSLSSTAGPDQKTLQSLETSARSLADQTFKGEDVAVISGMKKEAATLSDPLKAKILADITKATDWSSTPEGEKQQAEYMVNLYKVLHSNPNVQGITYWDLSDKNSWKDAPRGWFRADGSPKPVVAAMEKLFAQWRKESGENTQTKL